jgi:hypothetical protein
MVPVPAFSRRQPAVHAGFRRLDGAIKRCWSGRYRYLLSSQRQRQRQQQGTPVHPSDTDPPPLWFWLGMS